MKTFLMIVAAIVLIILVGIYYIYNSFTYQPEYFAEVETFNSVRANAATDSVRLRIDNDLKSTGSAKLEASDLTLLIINQAENMKNVSIKPAIKKIKSEIRDGHYIIESVVDVTKIIREDLPAEAAEGLEMVLKNIPSDMLSEVYVAFDGIPVNSKGMLMLDPNSTIKIGDFSQKLSDIQENGNFHINSVVLKQLGINNFKISNNFIEISK
ncbi:MAG: hypothetical protein H6627_02260 [Calditrichae bacterium]|nr:hypothetical protein [Calditrichota bacterium]MCB9057358.1 hypothetical protein [Calditrichia bacterium]